MKATENETFTKMKQNKLSFVDELPQICNYTF